MKLVRMLVLVILAVLVAAIEAQPVGEIVPPWMPGTLDIHQINTGRGNSALLIMPDGTTMLVDAGNGGNLPPRGTPPRPDASRHPANGSRATHVRWAPTPWTTDS